MIQEQNGVITVLVENKETEVTQKVKELIGLSYNDFIRTVVLPQGKFSEFLMLKDRDRRDMLERIFRLEAYGETLYRNILDEQKLLKNSLFATEQVLDTFKEVTTERLQEETKKKNEAILHLNMLLQQMEENQKKLEQGQLVLSMQQQEKEYIEKCHEADRAYISQSEQFNLAKNEFDNKNKAFLEAVKTRETLLPHLLSQQANFEHAKQLVVEIEQLEQERLTLIETFQQVKTEKLKQEEIQNMLLAQKKHYKDNLLAITKEKEKAACVFLDRERIEQGVEWEKQLLYYNKEEKTLEQTKTKLQTHVNEQNQIYQDMLQEANHLFLQKEAWQKQIEQAKTLLQTQCQMLERTKTKHANTLLQLEETEKQLAIWDQNQMAHALAEHLEQGKPCPVCGSTQHAKITKTVLSKDRQNLVELQAQHKKSITELSEAFAKQEMRLALFSSQIERMDNTIANLHQELLVCTALPFSPHLVLPHSHLRFQVFTFNPLEQLEQLTTLENLLAERLNRQSTLLREIFTLEAKLGKDQSIFCDCQNQWEILLEQIKNAQQQLALLKKPNETETFQSMMEVLRQNEKERLVWEEKEQSYHKELELIEPKLENILQLISQANHNMESLIAKGKEKKANIEERKAKLALVCGEKTLLQCMEQIQQQIDELQKNEAYNKEKKEEAEKNLKECEEKKIVANERKVAAHEKWITQQKLLQHTLQTFSFSLHEEKNTKELVDQCLEMAKMWQTQKSSTEKNIAIAIERIENIEIRLKERKEHEKHKSLLERKADLVAELVSLFKGNAFVEYAAKKQLRYIAFDATKRLKRMTNGRYAIEMDGSEFVIRDDHNGGQKRHPSALSGGEIFMVSLCLALSLSAKIQMNNKTQLHFFFLDEGFGSLDAELLEVVINALFKLREEKMVVGLISHVEDLKVRIGNKIVLVPAKQGICGSTIVEG